MATNFTNSQDPVISALRRYSKSQDKTSAQNSSYLSELQRLGFDVPTESSASFDALMRNLGAAERSEQALSVLGQEVPKPREGVMSRLFNQRTGIISAPFRAVTGFAGAALGGGFDPEGKTAGMDPFEAAARSARGEFAITGGDIIKVNQDDRFLERLGKYAGALAIDVVADPTNWFGGLGTFSRKGAAVLAVRQGRNILDDATRIMVQGGGDAGKLVDDFFERSRIVKAAKLGAAGKLDEANSRFLSELTDLLPEAKRAAQTGSPLDLIQLDKSGAIDPAFKLRIAGAEFGNAIGEALYKNGRSGVRSVVEKYLKNPAAVDEFMRSLPAEIAGGFYFKTVTGKPIARLAGGLGKGTPGSKALNDLRFAITAARPIRFIPAQFSGKAGASFAEVKAGLIGGKYASNVDRTKLLDYVTFKKAISQRNADLSRLGIKARAITSSALAISRGFGEGAGREEYESALRTYFFSPNLPVSVDSAPVSAGAGAAADLRRAIMEAHQEARAMGIDVGDLGPDWSPLRLTEDEYKRLAEFGYLKGGADAENIYRPNEHRTKWVEMHPDPEVRKAMGFEDPNRPGLVFKNAPTINKQLGRKVYEDDPIKLAMEYLNWINSSIASKRFVDIASETGAILRFPQETRKIVNDISAQTFMNAAAKVVPQAAARARAIADARRTRLNEALSEDRLADVKKNISTRKNEALGEYALAKDYEETARLALREADAEVSDSLPTLMAAVQRLREYGQSGSEQGLQAAERLLKNAMSRRSRAAAAREAAISDASKATSRIEQYGPSESRLAERSDAYDRASASAAKMDEENEMVLNLRQEVESAETLARELSQRLGAEQLEEFNNYQRLLRAQQEAANQYQAARDARIKASREYRLAMDDTTLLRAQGVDELVNVFVNKSIAFRTMRQQLGNMPVSKMPADIRAAYEAARSQYTIARKEMFEMLGYSTRRDAPGVGRAYAKEVVRLAEALTEDEITAARIIANSDRIESIVRNYDGMDREAALQSVGDIYATYKNLRNKLSKEDFDVLTKLERAVLRNEKLKLKDLYETRAEVPMAARAMMEAAEADIESGYGIRRIGAGVKNVDVKLPTAFRDTYAPKGIRDVLESMYRLEQDDSAWTSFISKIYDPLSLVWKTAVTVGRGPAYTVTNLVGGLANNYLGGVTAKSHKISAAVLSAAVSSIKEVSDDPANANKSYFELVELAEGILANRLKNVKVGDRNAAELFVEFLERGGHFSSDIFFQADELSRAGIAMATPLERRSGVQYQFTGNPTNIADSAFRKIVNFALNNPVQRRLNDLAASSEIFLRFAAIAEGYAKYGDMDSAMDLMHMLHFDYQDLSNAELWVKRFVPFYTWMRNNVPLQLRLSFLQAGKVGNLINANEEMKAAFGVEGQAEWLNEYLPDYMDINNGFVSYLKFGGNHIGLFPKLPINDVDNLFGVGFIGPIPVAVPRRDQFLNIAGPVVRTPMEFYTNRNFQYGYEYETFGELLSKQLESTIPYIGTISRAASAVGVPVENAPLIDLSRERGRQATNAYQMLFGAPYGATMVNERSLRGAAYGQAQDSSAALSKAAAAMGVDTRWLQAQLRAGVNPIELRGKILSGEGNVQSIAWNKLLQGKENPKDYGSTIQSLRGFPTYGS